MLAEQKERAAKERAEQEAAAPPPADAPVAEVGGSIPPPPGLPPPPPPPPGGKKKQSNLKRLAWSNLPTSAVTNTVFSTLGEEIDFDDGELASLFSREQTSVAPKDESSSASVGRISLLPMRRANNLSIVLSQFRPMLPHSVVAAIHALNTNLPSAGLMALSRLLPTDDELADVKRFLAKADAETAERLGEAEQFVAASMVFHGSSMAEHVEALVFRATLAPLLGDLSAALQSVKAGCKALRESSALKRILAVTLSLGNRLNASSVRGFRVESLVKMRDTRLKGGRLTALHFVADLVLKHVGELPAWRDAMPGVFASTSVSFAELALTLAQLERALDTAAALLDQRGADDGWVAFLTDASAALASTRAEFDATRSLLQQTAAFFGESATSDATDFFALFVAFFGAFDCAVAELKREQALAAKRTPKQQRSLPVSPLRKNKKPE